jgi:hypothetical protein
VLRAVEVLMVEMGERCVCKGGEDWGTVTSTAIVTAFEYFACWFEGFLTLA